MERKRDKTGNIYKYYALIALVLIIASLSVFYFTMPPPLGITGMATSQVGNLSVGVATSLSCTWSNEALAVSFGTSLNPGTNDTAATNNSAGTGNDTVYNTTVDTLSNVNANITIKGLDLISGINTIGIKNVTWISNTTTANGTGMEPANSIALTTSYNTANTVASNEPIGSSVWYRFWLDIPSGQIGGTYAGNYTMQCQQA